MIDFDSSEWQPSFETRGERQDFYLKTYLAAIIGFTLREDKDFDNVALWAISVAELACAIFASEPPTSHILKQVHQHSKFTLWRNEMDDYVIQFDDGKEYALMSIPAFEEYREALTHADCHITKWRTFLKFSLSESTLSRYLD